MKAALRSLATAAASVVLLFIAACSMEVGPSPAPGVVTPAADRIRAVGPCEMVDDATRAQFSIDVGRETEQEVVEGARGCTWESSDGDRTYFLAILPERMSIDSVMRGYDEPVASTVAGKRAVETYSSRTFKDRECLVFVEVADARLLNFQYEPGVGEKLSTRAQVCAKATAFAEWVVASL
ncbi:DUF3558 family protein [Pseudonocardia sp. N23]|uniref:DUF3558 family protein n=1 Tax=Pseudonocardia sp. N23 TaxID=1987376 RepID=UPI000BFC9BA6|nr:DUF3558 family protein [Pseudonocardia sp. N23]